MRRFWVYWTVALAVCTALIGGAPPSSYAQFNSCGAGFCQTQASSGGGGCSQATTFLARTSGLSGTETTAYTNLICGMVTDGTWCGTTFDALYIFATNTTTTANLNLCSTSFGLSQTGTVTFSADHGYTGDGSTGFLDGGFIPSSAGGNFTQNSAMIGVYVLTNRTTAQNYVEIGSESGSAVYSFIQPFTTAPAFHYEVNGNSFPSATNSSAIGHWLVSRTSSTALTVYLNGSSFTSASDTSGLLSGNSIGILALKNAGAAAIDFSADQLSAAYFGAGVNSAVAAKIDTRINGYMTVLGINVH